MYKRVTMTIIVLLIISVIVSNAVIPVQNNLTSYAENMRNNMISKTEGNRYKYVSVKNYNNYESMNFKGTVLVSHRGANKIAPENSIPAIEAAGRMGYWGVELDVCSSSDGVLYLLHDGTLNRTTNGKGPITKKTSAQINRYRIDKGPNISLYPDLKIPTFEDALKECDKYHLVPIFELKSLRNKDRDINTFVSLIHKHGYEKKLIVHSVHYDDLKYLNARDKEICIMPIINMNNKAFGYQYAKSNGFAALDCNYKQLNKAMVEKAHKDGLKVFCWVVDNKSGIKKVTDMGVDFICTDSIYPDKKYKQI